MCISNAFMYSKVITYIKQRIEITGKKLEQGLKHITFKKYLKGEYIHAGALIWYKKLEYLLDG